MLALLKPKAWNEVLSSLPYIPVPYSRAEIDYQNCYHEREDSSRVIGNALQPEGYVPMGNKLGIVAVANEQHSPLIEPHTGGVGYFQQRAMKLGASVSVSHVLYFDLSQDPLTSFSKGHRSAVKAGLSLFEIRTDCDEQEWEDFRVLHHKVSGRITRSMDSWDCQWKAIQSGDAFLVHLRKDGFLVGGGYFATTRDEAAYNVGVYDRDLFPMPMGHVVQYTAINEMKKRGLKWYRIGPKTYQGTDKEMSISDFKSGFATHVFPQYLITKGKGNV
jgi:FemAB family protein